MIVVVVVVVPSTSFEFRLRVNFFVRRKPHLSTKFTITSNRGAIVS